MNIRLRELKQQQKKENELLQQQEYEKLMDDLKSENGNIKDYALKRLMFD